MSSRGYAPDLTGARRGLATIAFLKAQFDAGMDHLDMFQPFVEEAIQDYPSDDIDVPGVQSAIRKSTGLKIPGEIVMTLLRRARKKGVLTRAGGRFLRTSNSGKNRELSTRIQNLELALVSLAKCLRQFATGQGEELISDDDALAELTSFLDVNHIGVVLGQKIDVGSSDSGPRLDHVVAAFVSEVVTEGGEHLSTLDAVVKGLIVQNALLLRDVPMAGRQLEGLAVFVDTGVLLRALGYAGTTERLAAAEALGLIRSAGARLAAFVATVEEVEGVLRVYEKNLGSTAGVKNLRGNPMTQYFLGTRATPADIRQEVVLLRQNLQKLGIQVRDFPKHIQKYTEDERALAEALRDLTRDENTFDPRVWHDVQAIAAVLTLRAGVRPNRMANAGFVFASGSGRTVKNATRWYREAHPQGVEPIVHFRSVTNAAWFLRPAKASDVPMHELVAVCAGVLRPKPQVWERFLQGLEHLIKSGDLSDDESIAILATGFAHIEPGELESETDVEATNVREIVERVRAAEQVEFQSRIVEERKKREASERHAAEVRCEADAVRSSIDTQVERLASVLAWLCYSGFFLVLIVGAILTLPLDWSEWTSSDNLLKLFAWACIGAFFSVSLLSFFTRRFHVLNVFDRLKSFFSLRMKRFLLTLD